MKIEKLILIIICAFVVTGCNKSITENEVASVDNTIMTDTGVEVENVETVTQSENVEHVVEDNTTVENENVLNELIYFYYVDICDKEDEDIYAQISVKKGGEEICVLSVKRSECGKILPEASDMIRKEDIDFDGNKDLLIYLGKFGEEQEKRYKCYLVRSSHLEYCQGFEAIGYPEICSDYQLLMNSSNDDAEKITLNRYKIVNNSVQKVDSVEVKNTFRLYDDVFYDILFNRKQQNLQSAYQYIINSYEKSDFSYKYDFIYFNDDDIPELVVELSGCSVSLYTFHEGEIHLLMHGWGYGAGGNHGYQYIERGNVLMNFNSDYGGAVRHLAYFEMTDSHDLVLKYFLKESYEDADGNVITDDSEYIEENWNYYYNADDTVYVLITKEEFRSYMIDEEYTFLRGKYEKNKILEMIEEIGNSSAADISEDEADVKDPEQLKYYVEKYLDMTVQEISEENNVYLDETDGTLRILSNAAFFPLLMLEDKGIAVICRSYDTSDTPRYVTVHEDIQDVFLEEFEITRDMNFIDIKETMTAAGWELEEHIEWGGDYADVYGNGELLYTFCSYREDGSRFTVYVSNWYEIKEEEKYNEK